MYVLRALPTGFGTGSPCGQIGRPPHRPRGTATGATRARGNPAGSGDGPAPPSRGRLGCALVCAERQPRFHCARQQVPPGSQRPWQWWLADGATVSGEGLGHRRVQTPRGNGVGCPRRGGRAPPARLPVLMPTPRQHTEPRGTDWTARAPLAGLAHYTRSLTCPVDSSVRVSRRAGDGPPENPCTVARQAQLIRSTMPGSPGGSGARRPPSGEGATAAHRPPSQSRTPGTGAPGGAPTRYPSPSQQGGRRQGPCSHRHHRVVGGGRCPVAPAPSWAG